MGLNGLLSILWGLLNKQWKELTFKYFKNQRYSHHDFCKSVSTIVIQLPAWCRNLLYDISVTWHQTFKIHLEGLPGGPWLRLWAPSAGGMGSVPVLERPPGEGNGNLLQFSYLENPMDRGAWRATVHRVAKSQTWLSDLTCMFPWYFEQCVYSKHLLKAMSQAMQE